MTMTSKGEGAIGDKLVRMEETARRPQPLFHRPCRSTI